jgi:putative hemolysin
MNNSSLELGIIFALLLFNGLLSMTEMAMISARRAKLKALMQKGNKHARRALEIAESPGHFLSTIQVGITLIGILTGTFAGATIASDIAQFFKTFPLLAPYSYALAVALVVSAITYFTLILGELVPKRLALNAPERIACFMAMPITLLSNLVKPLVLILSTSTDLVLRVMGASKSKEPVITEAEIHIVIEQAREAGVVEHIEQKMVASVLRLGDRKITSIMTPRKDIVWIDITASVPEIGRLANTCQHRQLLVAEGSLDQVKGITETKLLMQKFLATDALSLEALIKQPIYVPANLSTLELLQRFQENGQQIALVLDEYGILQGLITRDDILEAIVGEMTSVVQRNRWEAHQQEDGSWVLGGQIPLEEFRKIIPVKTLPGEEVVHYNTLAGFILFYLERIPQQGERFVWEDLAFEVTLMDRHRIKEVMVAKV